MTRIELKQAAVDYKFGRIEYEQFEDAVDAFEHQLLARIAELEAWKESAISVAPDFQALGRLMKVPLGASVHDKIIPFIEAQNRRIAELEARSLPPDPVELLEFAGLNYTPVRGWKDEGNEVVMWDDGEGTFYRSSEVLEPFVTNQPAPEQTYIDDELLFLTEKKSKKDARVD